MRREEGGGKDGGGRRGIKGRGRRSGKFFVSALCFFSSFLSARGKETGSSEGRLEEGSYAWLTVSRAAVIDPVHRAVVQGLRKQALSVRERERQFGYEMETASARQLRDAASEDLSVLKGFIIAWAEGTRR